MSVARAPILSPLLLLFTIGCMAVEGVWLFTLSPRDLLPLGVDCTHNFKGAHCREFDGSDTGGYYSYYGNSDLDVESSTKPADILVVAQIVNLGGGRGALMFGGRVLTGENIDGSWVFAYENAEETTHTESGQGYVFDSFEALADSHQLGLGRAKKGVRKGLLTTRLSSEVRYQESDAWNANQVGRSWSVLPASNWLAGGGWVYNDNQNQDCSDESCELSVVVEQTVQWDVTAEPLQVGDPDNVLPFEGDDRFELPTAGI